MKKLPKKWKKHGFTHILIKRTDKVALYLQDSLSELDYVVFVIRNETFPSEIFFPSGKEAWIYNKLENAEKKYDYLLAEETKKDIRKLIKEQ